MQTVKVNASKCYEIHIGRGLLDQLGRELLTLGAPCRVAIVTDDIVAPLYLARAEHSLREAGFTALSTHIFPHGEASKTLDTAAQLYDFFAREHITRTDLIVALGGGVAGDLTGFAASTWLRGVRFVQVPTTLLAQVDSSVGGKTAVDLPHGKNLVGTFCQPSLVVCDIDTLQTLEEDILLDGMAEVLKYGIIRDLALYDLLLEPKDTWHNRMEDIVAACVKIKRDIVQNDEFDTGERMLLNFGHTLGHAVEAHSGYAVPHGRAVGIGMAMISRAAAHAELIPSETAERIVFACRQLGLSTSYDAAPEALAALCLSDKKCAGGSIHVILPDEIGAAAAHPMTVADFNTMICGGQL